MKKKLSFCFYLNVTAPFYYFYIIPVLIALVIVSFDFSFSGLLPTTIVSSISSQHKFLNDFFALCNFFVIGLIFVNYFRYPLSATHIRQIRQHYATLNKNQQSTNGWLSIVFFCFTLSLLNMLWFIIDDKPLPPYKEWSKSDSTNYFYHFAHPYTSAFVISLQYVLIIFITLLFMEVMNTRKYRPN